jgi:small-conductance mechanosensitive channel
MLLGLKHSSVIIPNRKTYIKKVCPNGAHFQKKNVKCLNYLDILEDILEDILVSFLDSILVIFLVVSIILVVSIAGAAAGAAVVSGAGAGVAVIVADESVVDVVLVSLLPQDATKRPIERATIDNFTNFIFMFFLNGYIH